MVNIIFALYLTLAPCITKVTLQFFGTPPYDVLIQSQESSDVNTGYLINFSENDSQVNLSCGSWKIQDLRFRPKVLNLDERDTTVYLGERIFIATVERD